MNKVSIYTQANPYVNNNIANVSFGARHYSSQMNNDVFEVQNNQNTQANRGFWSNIRTAISSIFNRNRENDVQTIETPQIVSETIDFVEEEMPQTEPLSFIDSPDYDAKLKKATQGKYQAEIFEVLSSKNLSTDIRKKINESGLSEDDFFKAIKKLSTSTFKAALNNPTQYINYTQDPLFPIFIAESICNGAKYSDDKSKASAYMTYFFQQNIVKLAKALQYIDTDTLNQMMDKRSTGFTIMLNALNKITPENGEILKGLIGHTKEGDANQKIKLCQLVDIFQTNGFDMSLLKKLGENEEINTQSLNEMFRNALLQKFEITETDENTNTNFNEEYIHLLFSEYPMLNIGNVDSKYNFDNLMKAAIKGNFKEYILDEGNMYGAANKRTKQIFEHYGLNYDKWLNPKIQNTKFDFNGKEMTLQMWERNPQEDIFIGNKTRCCTAIATGSNSASMPLFLLNTAFNVIELSDSKGNVKGMARIYMANVDSEPSLVIDSIELSDIKQMSDDDKMQIAENIYDYARQYAQSITNDSTHVYYITQDSKIPFDTEMGKIDFKQTEFIGDVSTNRIYTNSNSDGRWGDIRGKKYTSLYQAS